MPSALALFFWIAFAVALGAVSNRVRGAWSIVFVGMLCAGFVLSLSWRDIVAQGSVSAVLMTFLGAAFTLFVFAALIVIAPFLAGRFIVRGVFALSGGRYGAGLMRSRRRMTGSGD